jgi:hypothetical protein
MTDERVEVGSVVGLVVRMVSLHGGVQIEVGTIGEPARFPLGIESPGELIDATGTSHAFVPGSIAAHDAVAGLIGSLLGSVVTDLDARESGSLRITFSNGVVVFVPPDRWEAWTFLTPSGFFASRPRDPIG